MVGIMRFGQLSQTARGAAAYRAVHQVLEGGAIFRDPLASRILDEQTAASLNEMAADESLHGGCSSLRAAEFPRILWQTASRAAYVRSWC
jgi:O-methyltransferase involved in polyketide biosynthesis